MNKMTATSPKEWIDILKSIENYFLENKTELSSLRIVHRCHTCFEKIKDITLHFKNDALIVEDWTYDCNRKEEQSHSFVIPSYNSQHSFIHITKESYGFCLTFSYEMGYTLSVPLTSYFPPTDYEVHGEQVYGDRNLSLLQKGSEDSLILMLQDFIDNKGLMPLYNQTIAFKNK